jgi:cholesterol transport system auxiliary component
MLSLALGGCASLAAPPQSFDLHSAQPKARRSSLRLAVETQAVTPFDSDLIVVRGLDDSLSRAPGAVWADKLPVLVQSRTIESFENAGLARQIVSLPQSGDYVLRLSIRRFDVSAATRMAEVDIAARLVPASGGEAVAAKIFSASEPVGEIAGAAPAMALDRALGSVLRQIIPWAAGAR